MDLSQASVYVLGHRFECMGLVVTYSDSCEHILKLVHERNQPRVVYVDTAGKLVLGAARGCPCAYAFGFVAMVGVKVEFAEVSRMRFQRGIWVWVLVSRASARLCATRRCMGYGGCCLWVA